MQIIDEAVFIAHTITCKNQQSCTKGFDFDIELRLSKKSEFAFS